MTDAELDAIAKACAEATASGPCPECGGPFPFHTLVCGVKEAREQAVRTAFEGVPALLEEVRRLRAPEADYLEEVDETNRLLDAAGMHVGSSDLSCLVRQLIADADNGRTAVKRARYEALEEAAKVADSWNFDDVGLAKAIRALKEKP